MLVCSHSSLYFYRNFLPFYPFELFLLFLTESNIFPVHFEAILFYHKPASSAWKLLQLQFVSFQERIAQMIQRIVSQKTRAVRISG